MGLSDAGPSSPGNSKMCIRDSLVAETCDFKVRIPMRGKLNSLNASAAAAILLYEAVRQRME